MRDYLLVIRLIIQTTYDIIPIFIVTKKMQDIENLISTYTDNEITIERKDIKNMDTQDIETVSKHLCDGDIMDMMFGPVARYLVSIMPAKICFKFFLKEMSDKNAILWFIKHNNQYIGRIVLYDGDRTVSQLICDENTICKEIGLCLKKEYINKKIATKICKNILQPLREISIDKKYEFYYRCIHKNLNVINLSFNQGIKITCSLKLPVLGCYEDFFIFCI